MKKNNFVSYSKEFEDLTFSDNYMFTEVMKDKTLCANVLKLLLGFDVENINYINTEQEVKTGIDARTVRLDVAIKGDNKLYDIEMQTCNYSNLLLRARYYQAALDTDYLKKSWDYSELRETYIIFICTDDPFGAGVPVYEKETKWKELPNLKFDDKTHLIVYNASGFGKVKDNDNLCNFLSYINDPSKSSVDDALVSQIEELVTKVKHDSTVVNKYMTIQNLIEESQATLKKQIEDMGQQISDRDNQIADKDNQIADKDKQIADMDKQHTEDQLQIAELKQQLQKVQEKEKNN